MQPKIDKHFLCIKTFWQYFKNLKQGVVCSTPATSVGGGLKQPPGLMSLKYCKNVIGAQNMLTYFKLDYLYICQGG